MSEAAAKVRLVRCPKCQNLLPELTDYSVYQCGGCGAVLRASKMNGDLDTLSEKSDEAGGGGVSEKSGRIDFSHEGMVNLSEGFENDVKSNASCSSGAEWRRAIQDKTVNKTNMKSKADNWGVEDGTEVDKNTNEMNHVKSGKEFEDFEPSSVDENGLGRSGQLQGLRIRERGEIDSFPRTQRNDIEHGRYTASKYFEEGSSNYYLDIGSSSYGEPPKNRSDAYGFDKVEYAGDDRAELLRKLDEIKEQITRSCGVDKEKIPHNSRMLHHDPYSGPEDWLSDSSSAINRPSVQYPVPDHDMTRPFYINHYEPSVYRNMHRIGGHHGLYTSMHLGGHVQGIGDPLRTQLPRSGLQHAPAPFQEQPTHNYFSGQYMNNDTVHMDPFETYPLTINQHHLSCACFYCYKKIKFPNKSFNYIPNNQISYLHENSGSFGPRDYGPRASNMPPFNSHNLQPPTRWPSDMDSEVGSFVPHRPPRVSPSTSVQCCRPMAGGAPFVMCYNCLESLEVPKVLVKDGSRKKMRCGSCSSIIVLEVSHKNLLISIDEAVKGRTAEADNNGKVMLNEGKLHTQRHPNQASLTFSSDDYDPSGYDFQSMDRELVSQSTDQPGSAKSAGMKSLRSTTSSTSEDEATLDHIADSRKKSEPTELPVKGKSPPPAGSSLQDYLEYSNKYHRAKRFENGNRSRRSDPETLLTKKSTSPQNSLKDASEATEIDISSSEYCNTGTSSGSGEPSREGDQLKANKAAESFFAGIIKKSFKDSNGSNQKVEHEKVNITVNGHLIPHRLIKKAEKLAGPIQAGHYWYDFRAGFWGVIGGPCLGIIPPFIEEFNYPMPENCTGGNTSVFVNGRELHQKDLNLLANRGLPNERNRSYIIEISGRVLDGETGDEIESLGKLAPTVEKVKHGFGMKPPKAAA